MWADLRGLPREHRIAGAAAIALAASLLLPWYFDRRRTQSLQGLEVFTWVEAAVLLVAVAVVVLVLLRARRRPFHLPGGDGSVIAAAGVWCCLLILYRMVFDRPGATEELGIEWGIFVSLLCAAAMAWSGVQIRAAHRPEPPLPPTVRLPDEEEGPERARPRPRSARASERGPGEGERSQRRRDGDASAARDPGEQLTLGEDPPG